jgi:transposase
VGNPVGLSKACGQAHPADQRISESTPGLSTGRHFHSPRLGSGVAVVEEPLQDSELVNNEPEGLDMKVTRGMRRRSAKLERRSALVTPDTLIAGVDLARKESVVVFVRARDKVRLGRLRVPTTAAGVQTLARRARELQRRHQLPRLVLGMEACAHYWKVLAKAATQIGLPYLIVQSFVLARARELDDLTRDKTDPRDAALIADLVAELRFVDAQLETGVWAELRLLAEARDQRSVERNAALHEQRSLLELIWPDLLEQVPDLDGTHVQATLRLGQSPLEIAALTLDEFSRRLRVEHRDRRFLGWMAGRIWTAAQAAADSDELTAATLRVQFAAERALAAERAIDILDRRMLAASDRTGLGWLRGQIRGLGDVGLVNLLALTGDLRRFDDARCLPKLAGSNPTERSSGQSHAPGGIHRRGRKTLRLVAYQAAVCLVLHNPDFRQRFVALTQREHHRLEKRQAYVAVANKLLRTLWTMATSGRSYDSQIALGIVRGEVRAA